MKQIAERDQKLQHLVQQTLKEIERKFSNMLGSDLDLTYNNVQETRMDNLFSEDNDLVASFNKLYTMYEKMESEMGNVYSIGTYYAPSGEVRARSSRTLGTQTITEAPKMRDKASQAEEKMDEDILLQLINLDFKLRR
jgi:membrane-bound lytic murein transglycosylase MltF